MPNGTIPMKEWLQFCHNCGEKGPHLVPPTMGEPAMFMCEPNPKLVKELEAALKEKHGVMI